MLKKFVNIIKNNYMVIFCIYFITIFLDTTVIKVQYPLLEKILKLVRYCTYVWFGLRLILISPKLIRDLKKTDKNNKTTMFLLVILGLLVISIIGNFIITRQKRLLFLLLVVISSYDTDEDELLSGLWIMQVVLMGFVVLLSAFGFLENYAVAREKVYRYSLGFLYTTNLAQLILFSTLLRFYLKRFKIGIDELIFVQLLNILTYGITYSRTEFLFLEIIIIITAVYSNRGLNQKIIKKFSEFSIYTYPIYPILSVFLVLVYPLGGILKKVNYLLSNRLYQTYDVIRKNGVSIFGKEIEFIGQGIVDKLKHGTHIVSNFVDNEYIQLMLSHGVLFAIVLVILLNFMLFKIYKRKEYKKLLVCLVYLLFGILNPRILNLVYSPIPFILFVEIIRALKNKEKEKSFKNME